MEHGIREEASVVPLLISKWALGSFSGISRIGRAFDRVSLMAVLNLVIKESVVIARNLLMCSTLGSLFRL